MFAMNALEIISCITWFTKCDCNIVRKRANCAKAIRNKRLIIAQNQRKKLIEPAIDLTFLFKTTTTTKHGPFVSPTEIYLVENRN